jgi:hypothetical protein
MRHASLRSGLYMLLATVSLVLFQIGVSVAAMPVSVAKGSNGSPHFMIGDQPFVPTGVNYLIQHLGSPYQSFDMFDEKTFDARKIDKNLTEIAADGYDVVRLWLKGFDPDNGFGLGPNQVSDAYADNVLTTLQEARRHGLYVILTGGFKVGMWLPKNYLPSGSMPGDDVVGGNNRLILIPQMAEATGHFFHDLLAKIASKDRTALDSIFYFDLYSELHFDLHQPPFSATNGSYEFDGRSYDLGSGVSRQALMNNAVEAWTRTVSSQVRTVDPRMLLAVSSFFLVSTGHRGFNGGFNGKPGVDSSPFPPLPEALIKGGVNLLDIHFYPTPAGPGTSGFHDRIDTIMRADNISADIGYPISIPLIAGEFGETQSSRFSREDALSELILTKDYMCKYRFLGYVVWSWNAADKSALPTNKDLRKAISPKLNPPFCGSKM